MMIQLTDKIFINPGGFDPYNQTMVHFLLRYIANGIEYLTQQKNTTTCYICKSPYKYPLCLSSENIHLIFLATKGDYWCQWVYQFAHEYLHHVISGSLTGEIRGMIWFEETLCEMSSIYQLERIYHLFESNDFLSSNKEYAKHVKDYRNDLLTSNEELKLQLANNHNISQWLPLLSEPEYHRNHYNAIACRILPAFERNPFLWHIIPNIGDSRRFQNINELFTHLYRNADESYLKSLDELRTLLLS